MGARDEVNHRRVEAAVNAHVEAKRTGHLRWRNTQQTTDGMDVSFGFLYFRELQHSAWKA